MQPGADPDLVTCDASGCPFPIEYSRRALDDIRLAVVDAFFSLPHGGAEIGGILLGKFDKRRVSILDYSPLECEHALGPSFTLSSRDHACLAEMVASARKNPADRQPVGWYHSHTRSDIFLSEADLDIHKRYFTEPWQVALVLKPHTFEPARAGLFCRGADARLNGNAACCQFALQPMGVRPAPGAGGADDRLLSSAFPQPTENDGRPRTAGGADDRLLSSAFPQPTESDGRPRTASGADDRSLSSAFPQPTERDSRPHEPDGADDRSLSSAFPQTTENDGRPRASSPPSAAPQDAVPTFGFSQPERARNSRHRKPVLIMASLVALSAAAVATQASWLPQVRHALAGAPPSLGLNTIDRDGQLQIRWNTALPAVRDGVDAVLQIADGRPVPQTIRIDPAHLRAGVFTYARQGGTVDVTLILHLPGGRQVREATSFLGRDPAPKAPPVANPAPRNERDQFAGEVSRLRAELAAAAERNRKLQKSLGDTQAALLREKQLRRLRNQSPDSVK
jgi:proteasome lid subunit RPN8/RPN11